MAFCEDLNHPFLFDRDNTSRYARLACVNDTFITLPNSRIRVGLRIPPWATQNTTVIRGMVKYLREQKHEWVIDADIDTGNELPPNIIDANWNGDGLIVFRCNDEEAKAWKAKGISVVNISTETQIDGIPNIIPDNYQMGQLAAQYLLALGLRNFAYIGEHSRIYSNLRQQGFQETLAKNGFDCTFIDLPVTHMLRGEKWAILHDLLNEAISKLDTPVGILTRDDIVAMNVLRSTRALNIKVPDDLALIGINDSMPYCHIASPKLSSVKHPGSNIGYHAAQILDQLLQGKEVPANTLLKSPGIVERESTNIIAVEDELVANVLAYIRQYAKHGPVSVADICQKYGVSNTTLRLRFKKVMGYSAKDEVDRVRHKEARLMLTETQSSVQEIAYHLGFNSPEELTRFFTRMEGISPTKYRINHN